MRAALSIAALGLLLAASRAQAAEPFRWEVPEPLESVEVPGEVNAEGIPVRLQMVRSKRPLEELLDFYAKAFARAGLYLPRKEFRVKMFAEPSLTAIDPVRKRSYTVILQAHPDRTTTVLMGEADVSRRQPGAPGELPRMPGAEGPIHSYGEGGQTLTYRVKAPAQEVAAFYREVLARDGWAEVGAGRFRRKGQELSVSAGSGEAGKTQVVLVSKGALPDAAAAGVTGEAKR